VPPLVVAVNVTGEPGVIVVGLKVKSVVTGSGLIVTVAEAVAVLALLSVTVTDIVLLPLLL